MAAIKLEPVRVRVYKTAFGKIESKESIIEVRRFLTHPAKVSFSAGTSVEVSPRQWVRIDVGIDIPCYKEEVDDAFIEAERFVEAKLEKKVKEIGGGLL